MRLSLVISAKDLSDPKLKELLLSIQQQDFPKEEMETLIITEGTSESAKSIGIRKAKGDVIGILASDNELIGKDFLSGMYSMAATFGSSYPGYYYHNKNDNILNRYFSLMGCNDPLPFYLLKNDKQSYLNEKPLKVHGSTLGDNGFFVKKSQIENTDLDNYYHIDNANELEDLPVVLMCESIWHKTGGNIFSFFAKRYHYGLQHAFNKNRRWHLVDFSQPKDIWRLTCFIILSLSLIQPLTLSVRGYLKVRDVAWFMHPIVCLLAVFTYGLLIIHLGIRRLFQSLSALMGGRRV